MHELRQDGALPNDVPTPESAAVEELDPPDDQPQRGIWDMSRDETDERLKAAQDCAYRAYNNRLAARGFIRTDDRFASDLARVEEHLERAAVTPPPKETPMASTEHTPRALVTNAVHRDCNSVSEIMAATKMSLSTVRYTLACLVKEKALQAVGKTSGRRYYLPGEAPRESKEDAAQFTPPRIRMTAPEVKHLERMLSPDAAGVAALEAKITQLRHELRGLEGALAIIRGEAA